MSSLTKPPQQLPTENLSLAPERVHSILEEYKHLVIEDQMFKLGQGREGSFNLAGIATSSSTGGNLGPRFSPTSKFSGIPDPEHSLAPLSTFAIDDEVEERSGSESPDMASSLKKPKLDIESSRDTHSVDANTYFATGISAGGIEVMEEKEDSDEEDETESNNSNSLPGRTSSTEIPDMGTDSGKNWFDSDETICEMCGETFQGDENILQLKIHKVVHLGSRASESVCSLCRLSYGPFEDEPTDSDSDIRKKIDNGGNFSLKLDNCAICDVQLTLIDLYELNPTIIEPKGIIESEEFPCPDPDCSKTYADKLAFHYHFRRCHLGLTITETIAYDDPHPDRLDNSLTVKCEVCEQEVTKRGLKWHFIKQHSLALAATTGHAKDILHSEKCSYCGKAFAFRSRLKDHIAQVHEKNKPYQCDVCLKSFFRLRYLKDHKRAHTGSTRYMCEMCGKTFAFSTGRLNHLRNVHKINKGKTGTADDIPEDGTLAKSEMNNFSIKSQQSTDGQLDLEQMIAGAKNPSGDSSSIAEGAGNSQFEEDSEPSVALNHTPDQFRTDLENLIESNE